MEVVLDFELLFPQGFYDYHHNDERWFSRTQSHDDIFSKIYGIFIVPDFLSTFCPRHPLTVQRGAFGHVLRPQSITFSIEVTIGTGPDLRLQGSPCRT